MDTPTPPPEDFVNTESVRRKVLLRDIFQEYLDVAIEALKTEFRSSPTEVIQTIKWCLSRLIPPPSDTQSEPSALTPMTEKESRKFRQSLMPFGIHKGEPISDVPECYLIWLDEQMDFRRDLRRYLESSYFKRNHNPTNES